MQKGSFFSQGFGKKIKMRWCVVLFFFFFSRSCFIQTENNISYDNKQNKYTSISGNPELCRQSCFPRVTLNVKAWRFNDSNRPEAAGLLFALEAAKRGKGVKRWRGRWTLSIHFVHIFSYLVDKNWSTSGLQLSANCG